MGYTHYWEFKDNIAPKDFKDGENKFARAAELIRKAYNKVTEMGIEIADGMGEGEPTISDREVYFNGKGDESCETFGIQANDGKWNFCKTARRPYDLLVCVSLLAFKEAFGDDFSYKSDGITKEAYENRENNKYWKQIGFVPEGPEEEWMEAYKVWEEIKSA